MFLFVTFGRAALLAIGPDLIKPQRTSINLPLVSYFLTDILIFVKGTRHTALRWRPTFAWSYGHGCIWLSHRKHGSPSLRDFQVSISQVANAILAWDLMRLAYFRITGVVGFMPTMWVAHYVYVSHTLHCILLLLSIYLARLPHSMLDGSSKCLGKIFACMLQKAAKSVGCSRQHTASWQTVDGRRQTAGGRQQAADDGRGNGSRLHHHACQCRQVLCLQ